MTDRGPDSARRPFGRFERESTDEKFEGERTYRGIGVGSFVCFTDGTRTLFELLGQEWVVDAYGEEVVTAGLMVIVAVVAGLTIVIRSGAGRSATDGAGGSSRLRSLSGRFGRSAHTGSKTVAVEEDDEILGEAITRLQQEGAEISGQTLTRTIEQVKADLDVESEKSLGVLDSADERGRCARIAIAPEEITEHKSWLERVGSNGERRFVRAFIISNYPSRVAHGWLDKLFTSGLDTNGADVRVSYHVKPRDNEAMMRTLNVRATRITSKIRKKQREGKINTTEEERTLGEINRLRQGLTDGSTRLFDFGLYLEIVAEDERRLENATQELKQLLAQSNATVTPLFDRQLEAQRVVAPFGRDTVGNTQIMDLDAMGTTFPFIDPSIVEPSGVLMGFHQATNTPVVVDRFEQSGHNMLVTGKIGSGKSYLTKLIMWRRLMMDPDTEILIIDPVGGFSDLVEAVDGQRITIDSETIINPLEIKSVDPSATSTLREVDTNPYDEKIRSVMGMFKAHFQGRRELDKEEEGVLRRAIKLAYLENGITKDLSTHDNESPTIQNVLDVLQGLADGKHPHEIVDLPDELGEEASIRGRSVESERNRERIANFSHSVLLGLEDFRHGGQRENLNGVTNVQLHDRVVQFDLSNVADGNSAGLFMHIVLDWLFQRSKSSDKRTLVTIDEAHYMLKQDQALDLLNLFARHSRHYNSGMTIITQTVDEFMTSERAKEIYDQCDIRALMRHQDIGEEAMKALNFTQREREFVLHAQAGNTAPYSESLLYVTDIGKMRLRVLSNDFEHHVVDGDVNAWEYLYANDVIGWAEIPEETRAEIAANERRVATPRAGR